MLEKFIRVSKLWVIAAVMTVTSSKAQELLCEVNLVTDPKLQITTVDKDIIDNITNVVKEFMNNTRWTKDEFEIEERINCIIQLSIENIPSTGQYSGSIQINATRPVYNSNYTTTIFSFKDNNLDFRFDRNQILQYSPNQFRDNLTSILAFYAYMILGYDYDSFSLEGGTKYFEMAQQIVTLSQGGEGDGWRSNDSRKRNRFYLIDNALQQYFSPLRKVYYEYHRKGLDILYTDIAKGRNVILETLKELEPIQQSRPGSVNMQIFLSSKLNELKGLFSKAEMAEKNEIVALLKKLDPANGTKYEEILTA
ncbi:DUF4835 family protein [Wandonia haliotis]|uniref:DUF4835 family protein n=1 Tax=Wandonia haliotis TaxID=574963 RepID=A0ABN1MNJ9_9FLAO